MMYGRARQSGELNVIACFSFPQAYRWICDAVQLDRMCIIFQKMLLRSFKIRGSKS